MKKAVIIGAGVSGLTAGIFLAQAGFDTTVIEKNKDTGGNLTGWDRGGYHIDNCIHWLTGTRAGTKLFSLWKTVGALENTDIIQPYALFTSEKDGESVSFLYDVDKSRAQMIKTSYKDKDEINRFFDAVCAFAEYTKGNKNPANMLKMASAAVRYGRMSLSELSQKFSSPLLRCTFTDYIGAEFSSLGLILAYSAFVSGNGGIPRGSSCEMAKRITNKYLSSGGKIVNCCEAEKIVTGNKKASGVLAKDKRFFPADFVIAACDTAVTFSKLLEKNAMPQKLRYSYSKRKEFPVFSAFHTAISADTDILPFKGTVSFDIDPMKIDGRVLSRLTIREFSHEKSFAPNGKSLIQCLIFLHERTCRQWIELKKISNEEYKAEKEETAAEILTRIEHHYPELKGKLKIIDTWTPATYKRYLDSYAGSFMSFAVTGKKIPLQSEIMANGYSNVVIAGQWTKAPGGLPIALESGIKAAKKVISLSNAKNHSRKASAL